MNPAVSSIQPYLYFAGRCEEAIEFYRQSLGAEVLLLMRFKDSPEPPQPGCVPPGTENKIMHATLRIASSIVLVSDGRCEGEVKFHGFSLSCLVTGEAEGGRVFTALAAGGQVVMPLAKTFFSPCFGMVTDRFGVMWMVYQPQP